MKNSFLSVPRKPGRVRLAAKTLIAGACLVTVLTPRAGAQQFAVTDKIVALGGVLAPTDASLVGAPYLDTALPLEKRVEDLLARLTSEEKASLLHGSGGYAAFGDIPRIGLGAIVMTDGPQGVRTNVPTTALPSGIAVAATWNTALAETYGSVLGRDAKATGHRVILGPGVNLTRTPLNGRNFEYFGEDPLLSGKIAAGYIRGVQSEKVAACIKHLAMNDQETGRLGVSVEAEERTLREFHLRPFEIAVRESQPWSCMPAYNRIRGEYCASNAHVNKGIMRDTFGFDGAFVSDWGAWAGDIASLNGGCTIRMPAGKDTKYDAKIAGWTKEGKLSVAIVDEAVRRNLRLLFRTGAFDLSGAATQRFLPENAATARRVAAESVVLLKNNDNTLPFDVAKIRRVLVVGPNVLKKFCMTTGGELGTCGGSGATFPAQEITALDGLRERLGSGASTFPWLLANNVVDRDGLTAAARAADAVVFVGGIDFSFDHEGNCGRPDKAGLDLPGPQVEVVRLLAAANPRTVAVLAGGSPMAVGDIAKAAPALMLEWYPGEQGGRALADLLFGDVSPSGKLPFTLGKKLDDWRVHRNGPESYPGVLFGKDGKPEPNQPDLFDKQRAKGPDMRVFYREGLAVGYRGFELDGITPEFAFGHGLSYTTFAYSGAVLTGSSASPAVAVTVKNTGSRAGAEVVQVYARPPASAASEPEATRPLRGLVAFAKVALAPGESRTLTLPFRAADLAAWNDAAKGWKNFSGKWKLEVASASDDVRDSVSYRVE